VNKTAQNSPLYIDEYDYTLPDERIAKYPLPQRDASKLLVYKNGKISESKFSSVAEFLPENALLVYNNTRVIQARLEFFKSTGARIEVFCLEPIAPVDYAQSLGATSECEWKCMVGNLKKWKEGLLDKQITVSGKNCLFTAALLQTSGNTHSVKFSWDNADIHFADILESAGELPIPPYLHRKTEESDLTTYQTVYSKIKGSVAAPTAGLHFTTEVFESLKPKNIKIDEVTLHVGAGTFQPVKTRDIAEHHMHTEVISVKRDTIANIQKHLGNIVAVGTTSVRTLESLYYLNPLIFLPKVERPLVPPKGYLKTLQVSQWQPYQQDIEYSAFDALQIILDYLDANNMDTLHAETQIMIKPGYKFRIVNGIITNFHQPKSTLLLLVSAFVAGNWKSIYDYALTNDFRFLSYGDSSLLMND
jgi:S-adenosylmethionine:tRNA ribosyltransferase-isomerase